MKVILGLVILTYYINEANSYPTGAPIEACGEIMPNHSSNATSDNNDIPYLVNLDDFEDSNGSYIPEMSYQLYLELDNDFNIDYTFRGFMIQARRVADDSPVGYFMNNSMNDSMEYQPQCDDDTAATHTDSNDKEDVLLEWVAPPAGAGAIRFRYAFVMNFTTFWASLYTDPIEEANTQEQSSTDDDGGLSTGAIVGIIVGSLVGVLVVVVIIIGIYVWVSSKKSSVVKIAPHHTEKDNLMCTKEDHPTT